jgi:exopolysaccharide production protein ExoQ
MAPQIALVVFGLGGCVLFWLDYDAEARTSKALWVPVMRLWVCGSRPVIAWLAVFGLADRIPTVSSTQQYIDGSAADRNVYTFLLVASVIVLLGRSRRVAELLRSNWPIVLFFAYCAVSILWSDYPFVAFKRWSKGVGDLLMVLIVLTELEPETALKRLLSRTAFILVPLSVLFIKYFPELGREYNPWTWLPMYCGVTETKNELGMLCMIFGLGSLWRLLASYRADPSSQRTRQLIAHGAILTMVFWLFWMANSMTSLACFLLAGSLIAVTSLARQAPTPAMVHLLVAGVVAVSAFVLFSGSSGSVLQTMGRDPTLTGRTGIWDAVLSVSGNPLLGTGYESFWLGDRLERVGELTAPGIQEAHNGYLELYLNLGWVGVSLLAVLIVTGYRNVIVSFYQDTNFAGLRLAFFVVAVIYSFTEAGFRETTLVWIFFLFATTAVLLPTDLKAMNLTGEVPPPECWGRDFKEAV